MTTITSNAMITHSVTMAEAAFQLVGFPSDPAASQLIHLYRAASDALPLAARLPQGRGDVLNGGILQYAFGENETTTRIE
jgi:hypothetical protein